MSFLKKILWLIFPLHLLFHLLVGIWMFASQPAWWYYLLIYPCVPLSAVFTVCLVLIGGLSLLVKWGSVISLSIAISVLVSLIVIVPIIAAGSFGIILPFISHKMGSELYDEKISYSSWSERGGHIWRYFWTAYLSVALGAGMCWFFPPIGKSLLETVQQFVPQ